MYDNVVLAKALHYLVPPRSTTETGLTFTPTMEESVKSFYQYANGQRDLEKKIEARNNYRSIKKIGTHPIIFGVNDATIATLRYVLAMGEMRLNFNDFETAFDTTFKIIHFCNIPYPPESLKFWSIINGLFYKLREAPVTGRMFSTIKTLNDLTKPFTKRLTKPFTKRFKKPVLDSRLFSY